MKGLSGLNEPQREAVRQIHGPVLILAGAGTGKTKVITTRTAYMIAQDIKAENILAVTFTNKAANEMRERVSQMVTKADAKALTISTFHSLCVRILRKNIDKLGYKKNFGIYAGADQIGLVRKIIARLGGKNDNLDPKVALSQIGAAKNKGIPVSQHSHAFVVDVFKAYQEELKLMNAVDFDDLLILAVKLLEEHDDVRDAWQDKFRYAMVDEFQDTNSLQMNLVRHLAGIKQNVCVVGDDDQSIYGWRGAEISNILDFERFFPNPKVIKLEENYRCTQQVLGVANSIIRHNQDRREKTLWCAKESKQPVRLISMPSAEEEAAMIVEEMLSASQTQQRPWEDFAILFRMNSQSRVIEQALREMQVPYRVVGGMSFFDRREIKDVLSYLMVLSNPDDDLNLLRVLNNPPRGIGASTIQLATDFSREEGISVWKALTNEDFLNGRTTKTQNAVKEFGDMMKEFAEVAQTPSADYAGLTGKLIDQIGYIDFLRRSCKTPEEANMRENNLKEFIDSIYDHRARKPGLGLQHFLDEISLSNDRESEDDISKKKGVCLITLHAAKGLEFPIVYLVGLEEGILPHSRSVEEGTRPEERRLLYVGVTRAKDCLTMTYCNSRKKYGEKSPCMPSSFIKEMDMQYIERIDYDDLAAEPATEETAASYFEKMKAMLSGKS